ncbi:MAG: cell division protein FtsL [Pseudomonadota bacterium]
MNRIGFALSMLVVVAVAAWAYHVNYRTSEALRAVAALESAIAAEHERLQVLSVEWAHLNAPERLKRLVQEHPSLGLVPLEPEHFGEVATIPYPPRRPLAPESPVQPDTPLTEAGTPLLHTPAERSPQ